MEKLQVKWSKQPKYGFSHFHAEHTLQVYLNRVTVTQRHLLFIDIIIVEVELPKGLACLPAHW